MYFFDTYVLGELKTAAPGPPERQRITKLRVDY